MDSAEMRVGHMACNFDLGGDQQAEMEFSTSEGLWMTAGPAIGAADVWMKGAGNLPDLRVRIKRTGRGIQITVDRGQQSSNWWPIEAAPRLTVAANPAGSVAVATASVGSGGQFQEVLLGQVAI